MLNFGHTIGHAIESHYNYKKYNHGEAISIGMITEAKISNYLGLLSSNELKRILKHFKRYRLKVNDNILKDKSLISKIIKDKKKLNFKNCFDIGKTIAQIHLSTKKLKLYRKNSMGIKNLNPLLNSIKFKSKKFINLEKFLKNNFFVKTLSEVKLRDDSIGYILVSEQANDIINAVNGNYVNSVKNFYISIWNSGEIGVNIQLEIIRDKKKVKFNVKSVDRMDYFLKNRSY